jgi:uncharacterized membrane protein
MKEFLLGALMMGFAVAAVFFARFYRQTRDRLFLLFGVAFGILAIIQLALLLIDERSEARTGVYLVRLLAFVIILYAIVDKNRAQR